MKWVRFVSLAAGVLAVTMGVACRRAAEPQTTVSDASAKKGLPPLDTEPPARLKVVALGDSITAGFGVYQVEAYPALLQAKLEAEGYPWEVVNAGESGDTSATALRRVDGLLESHVRVLIVAVGGNDALRGLPPKATHDNIAGIIDKAYAKGVEVLLAGMEAPPNLGEDYVLAFRSTFSKLRTEYPNLKWLPFLLAGVAGDPALNQADGIHPTASGQQIIATQLYDVLKPIVDDVVNRTSGGQ